MFVRLIGSQIVRRWRRRNWWRCNNLGFIGDVLWVIYIVQGVLEILGVVGLFWVLVVRISWIEKFFGRQDIYGGREGGRDGFQVFILDRFQKMGCGEGKVEQKEMWGFLLNSRKFRFYFGFLVGCGQVFWGFWVFLGGFEGFCIEE